MKLFDKHLYSVGLKRVKVSGMFAAITVLAGSLIFPISVSINSHKISLNVDNYALFIWGLMLFAPVIMWNMYSFMFSRRDSDFYHSLPYTRVQVFVSFFAAAMTWIWGIMIADVAICSLMWAIVPIEVEVAANVVPLILLNFSVVTLFLSAFVPAAISATGTVIPALMIYVSVLFTPKLCVYMFTMCLTDMVDILAPTSRLLGYLKFGLMLPFRMMSGPEFKNYIAIFYSLGLAFVYFGISLILFKHRKSETAENSAPSKALQTLYRICVTLPMVLVTVYEIMLGLDDITFIALIIIITLLVYYLYELITTKKIKAMLAATKTVWVLPLIAVVMILSLWGTAKIIYDTVPDPDDIKSVRVLSGMFGPYDNTDYGYRLYDASSYDLTDEEVINIVSDGLKFRRGTSYYESRAAYLTKITLKSGRSITRRCWIELSDMDKIIKVLSSYSNSFFPSIDEIKASGDLVVDIVVNNFYYSQQQLLNVDKGLIDEKFPEKAYELFVKEFATLTDEQKYMISNYGVDDETYLVIRIEMDNSNTWHNQIYYREYTASKNLMPETFNYVYDILQQYINFSDYQYIAFDRPEIYLD